MTGKLPRPRSGPLTTGPSRAPARAMLRAVGLSESDLDRPQVAVASSWNEVTPCNLHLNGLAAAAKDGVRQAGAVPFEFGTIAVSDGISMGTEGMKASLVSREIIADSVELMVHAERFDALVAIAGCDKSLPGMLMACARLNVPAAFLYGGTILPGHALGRSLTIQDVFEAVGAQAAGEMSDADLLAVERAACPGAGSCAGMYTANTMSACAEALGMALPGAASPPAVSAERTAVARATGEVAVQALAAGLRPRDILTRTAFLNAAAVVMATAGSTNAILHLLAIAAEAQVELSLDDFDKISRRTPLIASMRPVGRFVMSELDQVGGLPVVLRELLEADLIDGNAITTDAGRERRGCEGNREQQIVTAAAPTRRLRHPLRQCRPRAASPSRPATSGCATKGRPRYRRRGSLFRRGHPWRHRGRRRRRHPRRRPGRRPRHARNAGDHRRHPGPRLGDSVAWSLTAAFRRDFRLHGRPCLARSGARQPDRIAPHRRHDCHRRRER
jgi:dihydroxyacid dehydratase/phosphogluconate dehydratase